MREYLVNQSKKNNTSFHMPGHKGPGIYQKYGFSDFLEHMMDCDITEIPGADNLHQPEGIIKDIQKRYESLYDVKKSYILVNGSSCGIVASVLATVKRGGRLLMSRGCHRSVYSGITLGNITPCYIEPEITKEGIMGALDYKKVAQALDENPDIEALILPSPNYYGICSDIEKIAEEVHKRGKILIVDQAHGAHLHLFKKFCDAEMMKLPQAAEDLGADIVINSTHKTLATFTQTAVINVVTDRVDVFKLESYLHMLQSTSPSYLLMCSHDINSKIIKEHGREVFSKWSDDLCWFYKQASEKLDKGLVIIWDGLDFTKINIDASAIGWTGSMLEDYLMENKIVPEMVTENIVVAMSGIGNIRKDYEHLLKVLEEAEIEASKNDGRIINKAMRKSVCKENNEGYPVTEVIRHGEKVVEMNLSECEGFASADLLIPYPPGIPILCPGEKVTEEIIACIENLVGEGRQVLGLSEKGAIHIYEK